MKFEVLKVNERDLKNNFFVGETFKGEWEILEENEDFTEVIVWDSKNDRGIAPHKIKILEM